MMACVACPGHVYRDPATRQIFTVTHVGKWLVRVIDEQVDEPRMLNKSMFEKDCVQVSV